MLAIKQILFDGVVSSRPSKHLCFAHQVKDIMNGKLLTGEAHVTYNQQGLILVTSATEDEHLRKYQIKMHAGISGVTAVPARTPSPPHFSG